MKHAHIFPGQGAQFAGMGKSLYQNSEIAKKIFEDANDILGFDITTVMFSGSEDELRQTNITQPAIFIHSVAAFLTIPDARPDMVAGHSLGEFSALVANRTLDFASALKLVSIRAKAMQSACEANPSAMAAVLGLSDEEVENVCAQIAVSSGEVIVPANYNCPGQLVISGSSEGIRLACERLKDAGARRAMVLPVGGAFHSPLMEPAREQLATAITATKFEIPVCPVYQNVVASAVSDPSQIKDNLVAQLTGPVKWTHCVMAMIKGAATHFTECGPGKVLQGLVQKIDKSMIVAGVS